KPAEGFQQTRGHCQLVPSRATVIGAGGYIGAVQRAPFLDAQCIESYLFPIGFGGAYVCSHYVASSTTFSASLTRILPDISSGRSSSRVEASLADSSESAVAKSALAMTDLLNALARRSPGHGNVTFAKCSHFVRGIRVPVEFAVQVSIALSELAAASTYPARSSCLALTTSASVETTPSPGAIATL